MVGEIDADIGAAKLYRSPRLTEVGWRDYPGLLKMAAELRDDAWPADELRKSGRINVTEERRKPNGGFTTARVPAIAPDMLAEGEFNRFYLRALCLHAVADGTNNLIIYRAKAVTNSRPDSQAKIDTLINAAALLTDLRSNIGIDTALGLPPGPNSGPSARLQ